MAPGEQSLFDVDPSSSELGSAPGLWALMQVPGVGSTTALKLAQACSSWEQLAANPEDALIQANARRVDPHVLASPLSANQSQSAVPHRCRCSMVAA